MRYQEKKEAKEFWSNLWSKNGTHNENTKCLKDFKTSMNGKLKQEKFITDSGKVQNVLSKITASLLNNRLPLFTWAE